MRAQANRLEDKRYLQGLAEVLDISEKRIRLDECGDWNLVSPKGIISTDSENWYLYVSPNSKIKWNNIKKKLSFMDATQDGDEEGVLRSNLCMSSKQAKNVRKVIGGRRRTHLSEEDRALLKNRLKSSSPEGV